MEKDVKLCNIIRIKQIKCVRKEKNEKIKKKLKKCVDKLRRDGYNKITKTNSHR